MVKMIKNEAKGKKTLAIGDGANDVNMIISAHVGVGILSKEGNSAAAFADYAMPDFQCLRRVLFWHGRPFMIRLQNMILWIIFRSAVFAFMVFWVELYNGVSGQQPIETFIYAMTTVNLTTFAVGFYVVFEIDVSFRKYGYSLEAE